MGVVAEQVQEGCDGRGVAQQFPQSPTGRLEVVHETRFLGELVSSRFYRIPLTRFRWSLKRVGVRASGRRVAVRSTA